MVSFSDVVCFVSAWESGSCAGMHGMVNGVVPLRVDTAIEEHWIDGLALGDDHGAPVDVAHRGCELREHVHR